MGPDISIIVAVYNEEPNLRPLYDGIKTSVNALGRSHELLFVDDGSTDASWNVISDLAGRDRTVRAIRLKQNTRKTGASFLGLRNARGAVVITMDADLQNDPADVPLFLAGIDEGYDLVAGVRAKRRDNWLRRFSSRFANSVRRTVLRGDVRDAGCGYRAFRRACLADIPFYEGMHRFLPDLFLLRGLKVKQIPISHHPRLHGRSKFGIRNRAVASAADLLAVRWMQRRQIQVDVSEILND